MRRARKCSSSMHTSSVVAEMSPKLQVGVPPALARRDPLAPACLSGEITVVLGLPGPSQSCGRYSAMIASTSVVVVVVF